MKTFHFEFPCNPIIILHWTSSENKESFLVRAPFSALERKRNPSSTFFALRSLNNLIISTYFSLLLHCLEFALSNIFPSRHSPSSRSSVYLMAFIQYLMLHIQHKYYSKWLWVEFTTRRLTTEFSAFTFNFFFHCRTKNPSLQHLIQSSASWYDGEGWVGWNFAIEREKPIVASA